jgi:hypothetical protein
LNRLVCLLAIFPHSGLFAVGNSGRPNVEYFE